MKKHGFTIIETALVLAVAGLILLMMFIALPALQRQQRDTKRRDDTLVFLEALKKYQQNNRGALPYKSEDNDTDWVKWSNLADANQDWANFYNDYLGEDFRDPTGEKYDLWLFQCESKPGSNCSGYHYIDYINKNTMDWYVFMGGTCQDDTPKGSSNPRNVAVVTMLESGTYCASI